MAEVVDSIIAELIVKNEAYVRGFNEATAANERFFRSLNKLNNNNADLNAAGQKYKAGADKIAQAEEQTTQRVTKARKARTDAVKQAGNDEVRTEIETQRRITKAVEDGIAARSNAMRRGSGTRIGATVPGRADNARQGLLGGASPGAVASAQVAAEKEINAAKVEQIRLEDSLTYLTGKRRQEAADLLAEMRLSNRLEAEGVAESEIALRLEQRRLAVAAERAVATKATGGRGGFGGANEFALQASGGRFGYSFGPGALAGAAAAAGIGAGVASIDQATKFAAALNDVSKQAGLSAEALQVYYRAARDTGAKTTDVDQALAHLADQLAKARTGSKDAQKAFDALGVSFKGNETAGQLLPTLIDRLSQVGKESRRNAAELDLFGDAGKRLDAALSGGNDKVKELAAGMAATGDVLSDQDVARLAKLATTLEDVKEQLLTHVSGVVSENAASIADLAKQFEGLAASIADAVGAALRAFRSLQNSQAGQDFANDSPVALGGRIHDAIASRISNDPRLKSVGAHLRQLFGLNPAGPDYDAQSNTIDALSAKYPNIRDLLNNQVKAGKPNNSLLDRLNANNGARGKSVDELQNEADQRTKRFNDAMARYQDEILEAMAQQTSDEEKRRDIEREQLRRDEQRQIDDLRTQADIDRRKAPNDAALIDDRLNQQIKKLQEVTAERLDKINLDSTLSALDRQNEADNAILEFKNEQLQAQEQLAKTAAERRDLEFQILANEQKIAENNANLVLNRSANGDPSITNAQIDAANRTLKNLPASTASKTNVINNQTQGPWAQYVSGLPTTAKQIDEEFQKAAVSGVERLNDSLDQSITKMLHLHGVAGEFLNDLIQIGLHALEGSLFGGDAGSSGGLGGLLGGLGRILGGGGLNIGSNIASVSSSLAASNASGFGSILGGLTSVLPGLAGGGTIDVLGRGGIDQNVLSLNGQPVARVNMGEKINVVNPNQQINSGGMRPMPINQTINIDNRSSLTPSDFAQEIISISADHANRVAAQSGAQAVQAAPAKVRQTQTLKGQ